ncbi:hypothetical protein SUGI_0958770 [Cryptomeria japonica]|nr:hypothetical protein SUGI_0958770 [Cryptomeria japonica]
MKNQVAMNFTNPKFDAKWFIGHCFSYLSTQSNSKLWSFKAVSTSGDNSMIKVMFKGEEKQFAMEDFSSMVFLKMGEFVSERV